MHILHLDVNCAYEHGLRLKTVVRIKVTLRLPDLNLIEQSILFFS